MAPVAPQEQSQVFRALREENRGRCRKGSADLAPVCNGCCVVSLQEGSFLLTHLAGDSSVSIYKSSDGIATRAMYNLHAAHADLPPAPAALSVPWVPLDPNIPLPYHFAQGRVPCTFPPVPDKGTRTTKVRKDCWEKLFRVWLPLFLLQNLSRDVSFQSGLLHWRSK